MLKSSFTSLAGGACFGAAALFSATMFPHSALASSCDREIVVPIKFTPGSVSWHHHGVGTTFVGQFSKGQTLVINAVGRVFSGDDNGKIEQTIEPWT
jgi:hypothetical protein